MSFVMRYIRYKVWDETYEVYESRWNWVCLCRSWGVPRIINSSALSNFIYEHSEDTISYIEFFTGLKWDVSISININIQCISMSLLTSAFTSWILIPALSYPINYTTPVINWYFQSSLRTHSSKPYVRALNQKYRTSSVTASTRCNDAIDRQGSTTLDHYSPRFTKLAIVNWYLKPKIWNVICSHKSTQQRQLSRHEIETRIDIHRCCYHSSRGETREESRGARVRIRLYGR